MNFNLLSFLELIGALAFFIFGMKIMSESIQKVAGSQMREILRSMTSNRFKGVLTGFLITSLVQSSSATTVLIVSFVNAGLLSLVESISVIMGANIGTTITAWLISIIGFKVKLATYSLPIMAIGFPMLFASKDRIKSWGEVLMGFAILFLGLEYLKDSVPDIKSNPQILEFLASYTDLGLLSTIIFVGIGTLLTVVVQSSSAAMALTLVMANNGWISFDLAASMVLGENIGTTITANLAAIVGNVHAKRAAFSHFIFNIFGVIWIILLLHFVIGVINDFLTTSEGLNPFNTPEMIPIGLSIFHTTFNIINVSILVWFIPNIAEFVTKIIKTKGDDEEFKLKYIGTGLMNTAELSLEEAQKETIQFGQIIEKMADQFKKLLDETKADKHKKIFKKMKKYEEITDQLEEEISSYLAKVADGSLSSETSIRTVSLLSIVNDLERVGDVFYQMSKDMESKLDSEIQFSDEHKANLLGMMEKVERAIVIMNLNLKADYKNVTIKEALAAEEAIDKYRNELREKYVTGMDSADFNPKIGSLYKDIFHSFEKVGDHVINVTEAISGETERKMKKQRKLEQKKLSSQVKKETDTTDELED
jgi:phosphate:Na+ symporter